MSYMNNNKLKIGFRQTCFRQKFEACDLPFAASLNHTADLGEYPNGISLLKAWANRRVTLGQRDKEMLMGIELQATPQAEAGITWTL